MAEHDHEHEIEERILRQQLSELENQMVALDNRRAELEMVKTSIQDLKDKKDSEILVPVGAGILMLGKVVDDKNLLINIGANIIVQKTMEESNQLVDEQIRELDKLQDSLRKELEHFM